MRTVRAVCEQTSTHKTSSCPPPVGSILLVGGQKYSCFTALITGPKRQQLEPALQTSTGLTSHNGILQYWGLSLQFFSKHDGRRSRKSIHFTVWLQTLPPLLPELYTVWWVIACRIKESVLFIWKQIVVLLTSWLQCLCWFSLTYKKLRTQCCNRSSSCGSAGKITGEVQKTWVTKCFGVCFEMCEKTQLYHYYSVLSTI